MSYQHEKKYKKYLGDSKQPEHEIKCIGPIGWIKFNTKKTEWEECNSRMIGLRKRNNMSTNLPWVLVLFSNPRNSRELDEKFKFTHYFTNSTSTGNSWKLKINHETKPKPKLCHKEFSYRWGLKAPLLNHCQFRSVWESVKMFFILKWIKILLLFIF